MTSTVYVGVTNRTGGAVSGFYRRPEDRDTWEFCDAIKDTHVHAIAVHPGDPAVVYAATDRGLLRSEDRGTHWTDLNIGQHAAHLRYGRDIVVAPRDPSTLFACVADSSRGQAGRLYRSDDTGATWTQIDRGVVVKSTMMGVAPDPDDPARIHCVARQGQTFSTDDGGASWRELPLPEGSGAAVAIACG